MLSVYRQESTRVANIWIGRTRYAFPDEYGRRIDSWSDASWFEQLLTRRGGDLEVIDQTKSVLRFRGKETVLKPMSD